ncbi:MAG: signal recognition particle-docking protein FtsY [Pseudonocardiales bacterium]|nr:signal recognition particle-docking protein FtsY [Pseudonocardiales bacterium]
MSSAVWISIAIAVALLVALAVGLLLARRRRISIVEKPDQQVEAPPPAPKRYQAGGSISFSSGGGGPPASPQASAPAPPKPPAAPAKPPAKGPAPVRPESSAPAPPKRPPAAPKRQRPAPARPASSAPAPPKPPAAPPKPPAAPPEPPVPARPEASAPAPPKPPAAPPEPPVAPPKPPAQPEAFAPAPPKPPAAPPEPPAAPPEPPAAPPEPPVLAPAQPDASAPAPPKPPAAPPKRPVTPPKQKRRSKGPRPTPPANLARPPSAAPPAPAKPAPSEPAPAKPTPSEPAPVKPAPPEPAPAKPALREPAVPAPPVPEAPPGELVEPIDAPAGRLVRLRGRLARSRSAFGQSLLGLLGAGDLDEDSWTDVEDTLLLADLGAATTTEIVERLREELAARGVRTTEQARAALRDVLIEALRPELDRSVRALPHSDNGSQVPGVVLIAGVNGTGKTTTTGKLARVLVANGRRVLLGAADTFRAAAVDQLATWGQRAGAEVVRGAEGADPASVAFEAVKRGSANGVDTVLIDTAGRLHTKTGLMDQLGKVKRVVSKQTEVDEVLLVLDATTGQNGMTQARVFREVVDVTGIVLTKLDGTAKGGIVFHVQRELGVPVKLVGLGEGVDDLAPFEPAAFVDALLG